jgi:hypothetical protein|tara:strand:- start:2382 stop:2780 length:399 start_codon:yes stop_codon:yes gene_type:complete
MPSTSKKQHNFMAAIANNPAFAKKVGVPQSVGKDFNEADKGRKFSKGGDTMASKMNPGFMAMMAKKKGTSKMAGGGMAASSMGKVKTAAPSKDGVAVKGKTKGTQIKMAGSGVPNGIGSKVMKKGGMAKAKC